MKAFFYFGVLTIGSLFLGACQIEQETVKQPNILFIAIDDLRPELGCYGSPIAKSPNIDALAAEGLQFNRAYCQQAICSPSRASIMTGARPESIGVIENYTYFRDKNPDIITLPQHLKANGYETVNIGKIYHGAYNDQDLSWSRKPDVDKVVKQAPEHREAYVLPENQEVFEKNKAAMIQKYGDAAKRGLGNGPAFESAPVPDQAYQDGFNTDVAIATLKELVKQDKPFFLGLGFYKPHLNWNAPKHYWDMYNPNEIPLANQTKAPVNGAEMGLHPSFELRVRYGIPKQGDIDTTLARTLKHAYLACVSYIDAQIGRMIEALEEAGVRENTIIILWSDHGWHLGEMGIWGKATNYEISARVPMLIWTPEMKGKSAGRTTNALVELVDIYPTLCDLTGIEQPEHLEGTSYVPLLENPEQEWKKVAFSQFPTPALREWAANPLSQGMRETYFGPLIVEVEERIKQQQKEKWDRDLFENRLMGYSMKTDKHRFIVWKDYTDSEAEPLYYELFDHTTDPHETENIAETNPDLVQKLYKQFTKEWKTCHKGL